MTPQLPADIAVPLATAWALHAAESQGIRALLIKGFPLFEYGLRENRLSADVDVLIEPSRFDDMLRIVENAGWTPLPTTHQQVFLTTHSVTFAKDGWPISLDVHRDYPGFLRPADVVFDTLWATRVEHSIGHRVVVAPDRNASVLILALHALRSGLSDPRHETELASLRAAGYTDEERARIADLATATGSAGPLREFLETIDVDASPPPDIDPEAVDAWEWRVSGVGRHNSESTVAGWISALNRASWAQRPRMVGRAIWPTRRDVLIHHPEIADTWGAVTAERLRRIGRGIRSLPVVLRRRARRRGRHVTSV